VVLCVRQVETYLNQLSSGYGLRGTHSALERLDELRAALMDQPIELILHRGLHEFLDWVQIQFIEVQRAVAAAFWPPAVPVGQSQSRSQG
jgi:uncharacterized alpha-E superfamily protein